jgi:hypothetical protein
MPSLTKCVGKSWLRNKKVKPRQGRAEQSQAAERRIAQVDSMLYRHAQSQTRKAG